MHQNHLPPEMVLLDEHETAKIIQKKVSTLRADRVRGGGIPFVKLGNSVRYRYSDIERYIKAGLRTSTSDCSAGGIE